MLTAGLMMVGPCRGTGGAGSENSGSMMNLPASYFLGISLTNEGPELIWTTFKIAISNIVIPEIL